MDNYAKTILEDRSRVLLLLTGNEGDGKIQVAVEGSSDGQFNWVNAT